MRPIACRGALRAGAAAAILAAAAIAGCGGGGSESGSTSTEAAHHPPPPNRRASGGIDPVQHQGDAIGRDTELCADVVAILGGQAHDLVGAPDGAVRQGLAEQASAAAMRNTGMAFFIWFSPCGG